MATANAINCNTAGITSYNGSGTFTGRTITGTTNQIVVTNGDGISGNPVLSLPTTIRVGGISFDSGLNTLNNYTEGTFSPTFTGSTSNPSSVTYTVQVGRYTRVGRIVNVYITLVTSAMTGGSGNLLMASLPYTVKNSTDYRPSGNLDVAYNGATVLSTAYANIFVVGLLNTTRLGLFFYDAVSGSNLQVSAPNATNTMSCTIDYEV